MSKLLTLVLKGSAARSFLIVLLMAGRICMLNSSAQVNILTNHNDNSRTGQNLQETTLTPSGLNSGTFGLILGQPVDGQIYAQPLYESGLVIGQTSRNVVFVTTEADSVYAFDADTAVLIMEDFAAGFWGDSR